jgi:hypothetical protein
MSGCGDRFSEESTRKTFAKVWSGRTDGTLDFRLESNPAARYLLLPPEGYDPLKKYELWVAFHGIAGTAEDGLTEWYHLAKERGAFLLSPHGSRRLRADSHAAK